MQWTPDRNAGFSTADSGQLYLPPLMDPVYGYQAVNVEAERRDSASFLNWLRRMHARAPAAPGVRSRRLRDPRGVDPVGVRLPAHPRRARRRAPAVLCVDQLLGRGPARGAVPVAPGGAGARWSCSAACTFPAIGELPYFVTLPPYEFLWFELDRTPTGRRNDRPSTRRLLQRARRVCCPPFLAGQRWYAAVDRPRRVGSVGSDTLHRRLAQPAVGAGRGDRCGAPASRYWYQLPLGGHLREHPGAAPRRRPTLGSDAHPPGRGPPVRRARGRGAGPGVLRRRRPRGSTFSTVRAQPGEQSNTSLVLDERYIVKVFRRVQPGPNPDVEVTEALGQGRLRRGAGARRRCGAATRTDLAVVRRYERSRGVTAWSWPWLAAGDVQPAPAAP